MKKAFLEIISILIILTIIIAGLQKGFITSNTNNFNSLDNSGYNHEDNITKTKELSLNSRLTLYNSGSYKKIEIEDGIDLNGFIFIDSGVKNNIFGGPVVVDNFYLVTTKKPSDTSLSDLGLNLTGDTQINTIYNEESIWTSLLKEFGGVILFMIIFVIGFRLMMGKGNSAGGLMDIKVGKKSTKETSKTKFADVAGMEEVKNELIEIVDYLKNPEKYRKVGARHPKGVLLFGAPGSGKTLLARAVAGEANVAFFSASGSEFMEMLVGMGAAKVRTLFKEAKESGKAIIFIDEIDAIGKKRGNGVTGGHQEQEQTLNQILTEMDGFDNQTNIIVMAATNRPDILDPALLRAGRFDRKIYVTEPTSEERTEIFKYYLKNKQISKDVNIQSLTKRTSGLVGADIENIVNEASLKIAKENREVLESADFEYALEKVIMGPEKKMKGIQESEKRNTAIHELGHALLAHIQPEADPVEKISIVRRGQALGVTWTTPVEDKYTYSKKYLLEQLSVLLAGRAAEEIFFGIDEITTGASNDFEKASKIVNNMLVKFGMDEDLGLAVYNDNSEYSFSKPYSEKKSEEIDKKVKEYLDRAYGVSKQVILDHKDTLLAISEILIKKEYLSGEDFSMMVEFPEKIPEFKESDEILNNIEKVSEGDTNNESHQYNNGTTAVIDSKNSKTEKSKIGLKSKKI